MLKLVLKLFHHGLGNIDMKFGGGTEQKERVNGKQESLTAQKKSRLKSNFNI